MGNISLQEGYITKYSFLIFLEERIITKRNIFNT
jgi:hypothetical protein